MDYEKALEKARAAYGTGAYDDATLEFIFPQIKESEEEKRVKAIEVLEKQRYFWSYEGPVDKTPPATRRKDLVEAIDVALSYLEKQKEQKPISSCDIVPYIDDKIAALQDMWREEKVAFDWDDMHEMIEDIARHFYQKEQKPAEWSDKDTEMYINVASSLRGYACGLENEEHKEHIKKELDWLENRFKSLRTQPKQEWSGVDDLRLHQTIDVCDRNGYPVLSMWLKRLPRRVTLQPSCNPAWRIWRNGACGNSDGNPIALIKESCGYKLVSHLCADGEKYIMLSDLEKLPGYNEK